MKSSFWHCATCLYFFWLALWFPHKALCQTSSIDELEQKRKETQTRIDQTAKYLTEVKSKQSLSLNELKTVNLQVAQRNELIDILEQEYAQLSVKINQLHSIFNVLEKDLKDLRAEYAQMVYDAYKYNNSYEKLQYLFASESISQLTARIEYFQQYSRARKYQIRQIQITLEEQRLTLIELNLQREKQEEVLQAQRKQRDELLALQNEKSKRVKELKNEAGKFQMIVNQENKLQKSYQTLIEKEIKKQKLAIEKEKEEKNALANKNAATNNVDLTVKTEKNSVVSDLEIMANKSAASFKELKGRLKSPVSGAQIISKHGTYVVDTISNIKMQNAGIHLLCSKEASVHVVFEGTVSMINFNAMTDNYDIIVSHGKYFTCYLNLKQTFVKNNQLVKANQALGTVGLNMEKMPVLEFQIWENANSLDPAKWLNMQLK